MKSGISSHSRSAIQINAEQIDSIGDSPVPAQKDHPQVAVKEPMQNEEDLQKLEREKDLLSQKILRISEESKQTIAKLDQDASQIAQQLSDEASAITNYHRSASRKIVETVNSEEAGVRDTVLSLAGSLDIYFWTVAVMLLGFGLVTGYSISTVSKTYMAFFAIAWIIVSVAILFIFRSRVAVLRSRSDNLGQLKNMQEEMTEVASSLPQPKPDVFSLQDSAKSLGSSLDEVATTALALVHNDNLIVRLRNREQLIGNFSSALYRYGFPVYDYEIQTNFKEHLYAIDNGNLWLESLLRDSKQFFPNASSPILKLIYYDFQGEKKDMDQTWEIVSKTFSLRLQFAALLIRNKLLVAPNLSENAHSALAELLTMITSYNLDVVKVEAAQFFERLASFKEDSMNRLALFDLNIVEGKEQLMSFMPRSSSTEKWRNEVLAYISNDLLHVDQIYVELLARDATSDASKSYWKSIIKSKNLQGLTAILARKRLPGTHSELGAVYQRHLMLAMESSPDAFSLAEIEQSLRHLEDNILRIGKGLERTAELYRLQLNDFSYVNNFVPKKIETTEQELISISAQHAQLKQSIFELLYFSSVGSDRANKLFRDVVESATDSKLFSDFFVSNRFVPKSSFNQFIIPLIRTQKYFDLTNFVFAYVWYEKLYTSSETLFSFMQANLISERTSPPSFGDILKICPPDNLLPFEEQLVGIASQLFRDKIGKYELTKEVRKELALAATALFLFGVGDQGYKLLCQKIPFKNLASRTLYRYINLSDRAILSSGNPKLDVPIIEALELKSDDPHFDYFKQQLGNGRFPQRESDLIVWQLDDVKSELKKLGRKGFENRVLANYVESMRHALYGVVDEDVAKSLLTSQVLSAYILTISNNSPVDNLFDSEDDFLGKSAHALAAKKDKGRYEELVKLSGGKGTRIGLLPLEMPFETFAEKFEEVFQGALKMYNVKFPNDPLPDPLPFYIARIFPSDNAFKEIMTTEQVETKPIEIVRSLIRNSLSSAECLLLLSILQPVAQSRVAIRNVVESVVDGLGLHALLSDLTPTIINQNKEIQRKFGGLEVDKTLLTGYNVTKLSLLCKTIADQVHENGEDRARRKFYQNLKLALPDISQLPSRKQEALMRTLFRRLSSMGVVFSA
jgi:hypothetical protein